MRIHVIIAALLLGAFFLQACSSKEETTQQYISKARQYFQQGQSEAALIELKNAVQKDPKNGQARYLMGLIHNARGEGAAAEIELKKAQQLGVDKRKVDAGLGRALLLQGKYQKVLDNVKTSSGLEGKLAAALYTARGNAFLGLGKLDKAKVSFSKALKQDPDYSDAYVGVARVAAAKKDYAEAVHQTAKALSKASDSLLAWSLMGDLLRKQNKVDHARAAYKRVLKIDPKNIVARLSLASMDLSTGKINAAKSEVDSAEKIKPKSLQVKYMRAVLSAAQGHYALARDQLQEVMKSASDYMPGVLLSGVIAYELGSYEQAHKALSRFLFQFPNSTYAAQYLVATDMKSNRTADATSDANSLVSQAPNDPGILALASQVYMQTKDYAKATELLEKAVKTAPKNSALMAKLGESRLASGDTQRAVADLEFSLRLDPKQFKAEALLVSIHLGKKNYDDALAEIKSWKQKQPRNPVIYNLEGMAYLGKKEVVDARKSFEHAATIKGDYFPAVMNLVKLDIREHRGEEAKKRLEDFLRSNQGDLAALLALAGLADAAGKQAEVVRWLEKAIKAHPSAMLPRTHLVKFYLKNGQSQEAVKAARSAVSANTKNADALGLLGGAQLSAGDKEGAIATYRKLVQVVPDSALAYFRLAEAQEAAKHSSDAESSLNKALEIKPDYLSAKLALATVKATNGEYDGALKMAHNIQHEYPDASDGLTLEGNVLMMQGKYLGAAKAYQKAYDIAETGTLASKIHDAFVQAGKPKEGEAVLLRRIKKYPADTGIRMYLAQSYTKRHDYNAAASQYNAVLKIAPNNIVALNNLAWVYSLQKDPRALDVAKRAYKLRPDGIQTADTLGWILVEQGEANRGVRALEKAAKLAPGSPSVQYHYAVALAKTGKTAQARKRFEELLRSKKDFPEIKDAKEWLDKL